jgi:hypothetical protein
MHSYSRDSLKLFFVLALTFASMGTLFTSPSISMKNPSMLTASSSTSGGRSAQRFCMAPMKALKECEKRQSKILKEEEEEEEQCNDINDRRLNVQICDMVVQRAFADINMSGCPKQIKFVTLCEDEWCHQKSSTDRKSCQKECAGVRESLNVCINQRMMKYFKWNGLQEDGTTMI